ncbi:unnamed protein product [Sphenostylis stenocarpa]|uniref:Uncharacterized protein n=1 Tax=Sphenostylis stenocarpa TaxID=92480 RepID=A0AA86S254_9FABA|nr:unnamed protein product [Sphenostylis stenocarpa]
MELLPCVEKRHGLFCCMAAECLVFDLSGIYSPLFTYTLNLVYREVLVRQPSNPTWILKESSSSYSDILPLRDPHIREVVVGQNSQVKQRMVKGFQKCLDWIMLDVAH